MMGQARGRLAAAGEAQRRRVRRGHRTSALVRTFHRLGPPTGFEPLPGCRTVAANYPNSLLFYLRILVYLVIYDSG